MQSLLQMDLLLQVSGLTPGRVAAIVPGIMGLISVIIGRLALARSARGTGSWRTPAIVALGLGLLCILLSVLHLASTTGGFGTGSGRLGAIVALVLGLTGTVFSWLALARLRRIANRSSDVL